MWASDYSSYMREVENYDRVIDVSWVTDEADNCLTADDEGHLSIRGHHIVADTVRATIKKTWRAQGVFSDGGENFSGQVKDKKTWQYTSKKITAFARLLIKMSTLFVDNLPP